MWIGYIVAMTIAEAMVAAGVATAGIVAHGLVLVALPLHAALASDRERPFLLALGLVPLLRVTNIAVSLPGIPEPAELLLVSALLAPSLAVFIRNLGLTRSEVGLRVPCPPLQVAIGLVGLPLGAILWMAEAPVAPLEPTGAGATLGLAVVLGATGLVEEFMFRGVIQATALRALGRPGLLLVSVLFTVLHASALSAAYLLCILGASLVFSWIVLRTRSIAGVAAAHALANLLVYVVIPLSGPTEILPRTDVGATICGLTARGPILDALCAPVVDPAMDSEEPADPSATPGSEGDDREAGDRDAHARFEQWTRLAHTLPSLPPMGRARGNT